MAKIVIVSLLLLSVIAVTFALGNDCPLSSQMTSCSPKCKDDSQCHGTKCCPNICNTKSCAPAGLSSKDNNNKYKQNQGGTGQYCGNAKCTPHEKCELDKNTNRQKCVRS